MQDIKELSVLELENVLKNWKAQPFLAKEIFRWIYQKGAADFASMSNVSAGVRVQLRKEFFIAASRVTTVLKSKDGTEKFLLSMQDAAHVEAVSIPAEGRVTGCVSSQVGCKFGCAFCASGLSGFKRNLSAGEILDEALALKDQSSSGRLTHIVFMGTGEPFDNYDAVLKAIRTLNAAYAFGIGARRITISTSGIIPGIERLSREDLQVELSVSLHASDDRTRSALMPVNKKYPLKDLIRACSVYIEKTNRQITFEYILVKGVNSDLQSARNLGTILRGLNCKVNLILANTVSELGVEAPGKIEVLVFKDALVKSGVHVTLRKSRGQDIGAACGQLRLAYEKK